MALPGILYHNTPAKNGGSIQIHGLLPKRAPLLNFKAVWLARDLGYAVDHHPYPDRLIFEIRTAGLDVAFIEPWTGLPITNKDIEAQQYIYRDVILPQHLRLHGSATWGLPEAPLIQSRWERIMNSWRTR